MLFRLVRGMLEEALNGLLQQFNTIHERAINPLKEIQGRLDTVWRGESANSFREALSSITIPSIDEIGAQVTTLNTNLRRAQEIMNQADENVDRLIKSKLDDAFGSIF